MKSLEDQLIDYLEAYCVYDITVVRNHFRHQDMNFDSDGAPSSSLGLAVWYQDEEFFLLSGEPNCYWGKSYRNTKLYTRLKVRWVLGYSRIGVKAINSTSLFAWILDEVEAKVESKLTEWGSKALASCRTDEAVAKLERALPQPLGVRKIGGTYGYTNGNTGAAVALPVTGAEFSITWKPKDKLWVAQYLKQKFIIESEDRLRSLLVQVLDIEQSISNLKY